MDGSLTSGDGLVVSTRLGNPWDQRLGEKSQTFEIFFIERCVKLQQKHRQMSKASQLPLSSSLPGTKSDVQDAKKSKARKVVAPSDDEDEEAEWNENDGSDVDDLI